MVRYHQWAKHFCWFQHSWEIIPIHKTLRMLSCWQHLCNNAPHKNNQWKHGSYASSAGFDLIFFFLTKLYRRWFVLDNCFILIDCALCGYDGALQGFSYINWCLLAQLQSFHLQVFDPAKCTFAAANVCRQLQTCTLQRQLYSRNWESGRQLCNDKLKKCAVTKVTLIFTATNIWKNKQTNKQKNTHTRKKCFLIG